MSRKKFDEPDRTYSEMERELTRDLAMRTAMDPTAHPDHTRDARARLASDGKPDFMGRLSPIERATLEALMKKARGATSYEPIALVALLDVAYVGTCVDCGGTVVCPPDGDRSLQGELMTSYGASDE